MLFLLLFFLELFLLALFSSYLMGALFNLFYKLTRSERIAAGLLAFLFLPGTILHELSHFLTASILMVPTGKIQVLPEFDGKGVKFGSVQIAQADFFRRYLIGIAPVIFGLTLIFLVMIYSLRSFSPQTPWWMFFLAVFSIFQVANTLFASKKDMEGALLVYLMVILVFVSLGTGLYWSHNLQTVLTWLLNLDLSRVNYFFRKIATLMLVPLGIDFVLILFSRVLRLKNLILFL